MTSFLARVIALSLCGAPFAAAAYATFGAPDCGQWTTLATPTRKAWLLGFMSGLSAAHAEAKRAPKDPLDSASSAEQLFVWMDNYCKANPLSTVGSGAQDLFDELAAKRSNAR